MTAWTWAFRRRWEIVELPEPLWLRALPLTMSVGLAVRIAAMLQWRRPKIVAYALENNSLNRLLRGLPTSAQPIALRLMRSFCSLVFDRIAFGSDAAHRCYMEAKLLPTSCATAIFLDLLPPCFAEANTPKQQKITFLAALEQRKGLPALLEAWKSAGLADDGWTLQIAGSGPLRATIIDAIKADASIHYLGELDRGQVHALLAESRIVVLPSQPEGRWKEQIGLAIIEGLAHGCHVVTSSDTGLADWLATNGHTILPSGFTAQGLAQALRLACSETTNPTLIQSSLPRSDGRESAEKWMYQ
jgi:glycosyltransferase involved in cell wall biosynthesis